MLRHIAAASTCAYVFFLSVRVSLQKNGAKNNPPRIPVAFCDAPFLPESPYALSAAYGLNVSLRARVVFPIFFHEKEMQNAEPVTCV